MKKDVAQKLLDRIKVDAKGCFLWKHAPDKQGYARTKIAGGKHRRAHRVSFEVFRRQIPPGMRVCHHCDVKHCINPAHLFLGTAKDNSQDAVRKGRNATCESHASSKLNADSVCEIARRYNAGESIRDLAAAYGVFQHAIWCVLTGRTWKRVKRETVTMRGTEK